MMIAMGMRDGSYVLSFSLHQQFFRGVIAFLQRDPT